MPHRSDDNARELIRQEKSRGARCEAHGSASFTTLLDSHATLVQVAERLLAEVESVRAEQSLLDRKARHGCYDALCAECDAVPAAHAACCEGVPLAG